MAFKRNSRKPRENSNSVSYSRSIARQLNLQEKDVKRLLVGTRLTVDQFIYDDTLLSDAEQMQILRNALSISNDPALGLHVGGSFTPSTHGPMGFLANSSPNLRIALQYFSKFLPTRSTIGSFQMNIGPNNTECVIHAQGSSDLLYYRMITETYILSFLTLIENVLGRPLQEATVFFNYSRPDYYEQYKEYFSIPVFFDAPENKLVIPTSVLDIANVAADYYTHEISLRHCEKLLKGITQTGKSNYERVKKILIADRCKPPSEEEVAAAMFVSKRTLSRRLQSEGYLYRDIRDEVIITLAESYLSETDLPIDSIANILGYFDSSSFRRAFKRAKDTNPSDFRKASHE